MRISQPQRRELLLSPATVENQPQPQNYVAGGSQLILFIRRMKQIINFIVAPRRVQGKYYIRQATKSSYPKV